MMSEIMTRQAPCRARRAWIVAWGLRQGVESGYSNLKGPDTESIRRGTIRVVGLVRTTLMLAFAAAHYNLRLLTKWAANNDAHETDPELFAVDYDVVGCELVTRQQVSERGSPGLAAA